MQLDRRSLLVAGGAGVGLIVAYLAWPREEGRPLAADDGEAALSGYVRIGTDGGVTIAVPQAETGQGIWTALAQVAADALGAAWEQVGVEPAPEAALYANRYFGTRITAAATSIRAFEAPLRKAGETARDLLVQAAARRWRVDPSSLPVSGGFVRYGDRRLAFAELAEEAAKRAPRAEAAGRVEGRIAGTDAARLDLPAKSDGSIRFAADVRLPGMLFAAARLAPPQGRLRGFDRDAAMAVAGMRGIVADERWLAAIADNGWAAAQGLNASSAQFEAPEGADQPAIDQALDEAMQSGRETRLFERGDYAGAVGEGRALAAMYRIAPAMHHSLEPLTATAHLSGGRLEVWAGVQAFDPALDLAARAGGIERSKVVLYPMPVGDSSGRAIEPDALPIAVALARKTRRPVQLTVPHNASANHDALRPPLLARLAGLPAPSGGLKAWSARMVSAPGIESSLARLAGTSPAPLRDFAGAIPPYGIEHLRIDAVGAELPIRCGYMRGGSEALAAFANESFVDEMARKLDREPLAMRMSMLAGSPRLAQALSAATLLAKWDGGEPGSSMGLACASAFGSFIALVAEASLDADQRVAVSRLTAVVDCGRAINPGLVRQQIEGSLLHALSLATADAPQFVGGIPVARGLAAQGLTSALAVPEILVELVPSDSEPGGVSGLGHCVLAPAIANALAAGTGRRLRNLPFNPMAA